MSDPRTASGTLCRICHSPISHPGADCPHCRSSSSLPTLPPILMLTVAFSTMVILFAITTALTHLYRAERAERQGLHREAAIHAAGEGRYEEAIAEFRDALEYDREDVSVRLGLAHALFELGRLSEAWNHLIDLRATEPTHGLVNRLLGDAATKRGRPDEAASYYRAAIYGHWPEDAAQSRLQARLALIELLASEGRHLQEMSELVELMETLPEDIPTRRRIGRLLLVANAPAQAAGVFQGVVDAAPDDAEGWAGLGEAEFARGHYLSARTAFTKSRSIQPSRVETERWLELCDEIIALDPTYRRAGTRERLRRSQVLLERALGEALRCVQTLPPGPAEPSDPGVGQLAALVESAEGILGRKVPASKSEESVDENVSLAEALWQERRTICSDLPLRDEPVGHVLEKVRQ